MTQAWHLDPGESRDQGPTGHNLAYLLSRMRMRKREGHRVEIVRRVPFANEFSAFQAAGHII